MANEVKTPIPARLYNAAVGGHVTNSQQIIDENLNREQNDINQETVGAVPYNSTTPNGMGRIVLKKTDNFKTVVEAQTNGNTIFVIKYDFTLTGNVTIPANCVLQFDGGSLSGAYTITGQNTGIEANKVSIFSQTITLNGVFDVNAIYPEWFGAIKGNTVDSSDAIQVALDNAFVIGLPVEFDSKYKIDKAIVSTYKTIIFNNTIFLTNVKRDFAFALQAVANNEDVFGEIRGNATFINQNTSFEEINQTVVFPATSNIPIKTVENSVSGESGVPYTDFTIQGAKVGDLVYLKRGTESEFLRFTGEVISDDTVRIYVNNHFFSSITIEDTEIEVKVLSGCCHGINLGGSFAQTGNLRCVKYTGLSFGLGKGLDEECGIRYKVQSKVYYSKMNINLFPAGGVGFRCQASNSVNTINLSMFSTPYSTSSNWPHTYAYIGLSISGIGNVFNNLSVEGTYHDYAIYFGLAYGNELKNIYTEFVSSTTYPNGKPLYTSRYTTGSRLSYCYVGAIENDSVLGLNNIIERKAAAFVASDQTSMNKAEINLLRDVNFEYPILVSGSGAYGRWYNWGANCTFSKVDGPIPNTKALRVDIANGRLILQQRILWNDNNIPDLKNINTNLCASAWVRGNLGSSIGILSGQGALKNGNCPSDEQWHLVVSPVDYYDGYIQVDFRINPDSAQTGYVEIFNPRLTLGSTTVGVIDDEVKYALDNHGTTRPINVPIGHCFLDETLGKPIWWNGSAWVDATGTPV